MFKRLDMKIAQCHAVQSSLSLHLRTTMMIPSLEHIFYHYQDKDSEENYLSLYEKQFSKNLKNKFSFTK